MAVERGHLPDSLQLAQPSRIELPLNWLDKPAPPQSAKAAYGASWWNRTTALEFRKLSLCSAELRTQVGTPTRNRTQIHSLEGCRLFR